MSLKIKLSGTRISTQLLIINALICIVFFIIVLMVFLSFHNIQGLLRGVIVDDMQEVTTNALTERELSNILADSNLLLNTFFENEAHLNTESNRLLTYTLVLISNNNGREIEQPLQVFAQNLGLLLQQCSVVNISLRKLRTVDHNIEVGIEHLEENITQKLIDMAFKGEDTSILEQVSVLVTGFRQSLFKIGKLHAQTFPEKYYAPISTENDPLLVGVDELILRFRTLMASGPEVAGVGQKLINDLQTYREIILALNTDMVELKARRKAVENAKGRAAAVMEKLDRDVAQATKAVDAKITKIFRITEIALLLISVSLVVALIVLTAIFFKSIIKKPMNDIQKGIKVFRSGNLESKIRLNRRDEWHIIEDALNTMAAELSTSYTALQDAHGELEAKVMERTAELFEAKEQALEAQKTAETANAAKSEFLARMSHEIRTPLNAVTGLTNIVLKSELKREQRDYLNKVRIASKNLLEVINDILDFSKVEAGRMELTPALFDLGQVLERLADLFSNRVAQKDLELIFAVSPQAPRQLIGDASRLTQILTNLIENAVKFTDAGEIVVRVESDDLSEDQAALKFAVSDTGEGIAADLLPTLFEPFTQAEGYLTREHKGTGLGLAICRRLVELMGGTIEAQSTRGQGSTFLFTALFGQPMEKKPRLDAPPDLRGLKTLVVDDSATARQVLVDLLESFSFTVTAVDSGEGAIRALSQASGDEPYQLVLVDWKMPGMDGIETTERMRALNRKAQPEISAADTRSAITDHRSPSKLPIIILVTAYGQKVVQGRIDTSTVDTVLLKPIKPSQLFNTIMALFGRVEEVPRITSEKKRLGPYLSGHCVLLAEDSELNRDVAVALLEETGLTVEIAENGRIAVDKVTTAPSDHYAAVFMDIQMPVMDGYQASRQIRKWEAEAKHIDRRSPLTEYRLPIIAVTAHALTGEKEKCLAAGMDDYIAKPIDEKQLGTALNKWVSPLIERTEVKTQNRANGVSDTQTVLDVQSALKRLGGRKLLYSNALRKFKPEYGNAHEVIAQYMKDSDSEAASRTAHSVKGAALAIGATNLNQAAAKLEKAINDKEDIDNLLGELKFAIEQTSSSIADFLKANG